MSIDNSGLVASALEKSNPALALTMDATNTWKAGILEQGARVALYRDYERGDHRAVINEQMRKMLRLAEESSGIQDFNGNYCGIVIDKMSGRLHVNEITTGDVSTDDNWLAPLLERNDWDNLQTTTFRGAIRDADSYIMIDPQTLTWMAESAYDGYSGIVAIFDAGARTPMWACKIWSEADDAASDNTMRLVVYEPGRVSYWRGQAGAGEVEPDSATIERVVDVDEPINDLPFPASAVPIVHFANRYENYSEAGESEIRAAIPLQDVYNRTLHSMVMASEFSAFRVAWSKGLAINPDGVMPGAVINLLLKDANGNTIIEPTEDMLKFLAAVEVGQFEATDITQYINQLDKIVREISQVTQTPIYGVTADGNLSGEALKQLEIGLIGKVVRFQQQNADAIRELVELTAEIQNAFRIEGMGNAPEFEQVSLTWKSPEILDNTAQITALITMRTQAPGLWSDEFYRGKIGGMLGMSQNDITKEAEAVKKENEARQKLIRDRQKAAGVTTPEGAPDVTKEDTVNEGITQ